MHQNILITEHVYNSNNKAVEMTCNRPHFVSHNHATTYDTTEINDIIKAQPIYSFNQINQIYEFKLGQRVAINRIDIL